MNATTTWALVVGIDEYDDPTIPRLTGAARDAAAAVRWLRQLGVPDNQILLHAAPGATARAEVDGLGLAYQNGALDSIWSSVAVLEQHSGDRLFVFLSGHGFYEPTKGRLFLTQNARQKAMTNLGIDLYITYFRSLKYTWQFLVVDGCQNYPYTPSQRMQVDAVLYPGVAVPTPVPGNALVAFFAASQGERVPEIDHRGAYLRRFFEAADPERPRPEAVSLDFVTGHKSLLARALHSQVARQVAVDAANQKPPVPLHPGCVPYGRAEALDDVTLFDLAPEPTSAINVTVRPPSAAADITALRLRCLRFPYWERRLPTPPQTTVVIPIPNQLPRGLELAVDIDLKPNTAWSEHHVDVRFGTDTDRDVALDFPGLVQLAPVATSASEETAAIVTVDVQGTTMYNAIPPAVYDDITRQATGTTVGGEAVRLSHHERGPDLHLPPAGGGGAGRRLISTVADRILRETSPDVAVATVVRRTGADTTAIRFTLTEAAGWRLAGPLYKIPTVTIRPPGGAQPVVAWRSRTGHSLAALTQSPFVPVTHGPVRVALDLPWGSWSQLVDVAQDDVVVVDLPKDVGVPPLRAVLAAAGPRTSPIVGAAGEAPAEGILYDQRRQRGRALDPASSPGAAWALALPKMDQVPQGQRLVRLSWPEGRQVQFPARLDGSLGIDPTGGAVRVEPLSWTAQPLWDLLVAAGRLDALTPEEAQELSYGKWGDPILGVAAAYALHATGSDLVPTVLRNLRLLGVNHPDVALLEAAHAGKQSGLSDDVAGAVRSLAASSAIPVLRWGVPIARVLAQSVPPAEAVTRWDTLLATVEQALSPMSVWTAWTT